MPQASLLLVGRLTHLDMQRFPHRVLLEQPLLQPCRHRLTGPIPQLRQVCAEVGIDRRQQSLRGQQALDAVAALGLLPLQVLQAAVQLPAVLVLDRRHVDDAPHLALAAVIAAQQVQQLGRVDWIGLGMLAAAVDFDG